MLVSVKRKEKGRKGYVKLKRMLRQDYSWGDTSNSIDIN
jgi:hypothetical protein